MAKVNNVEDLMSLIGLAENASSKIEKLKLGRYVLIIILFLFAIATCLYILNVFAEGQNSSTKLLNLQEYVFLIILISVAIFFSGFYVLSKTKKLINVELRVLRKLYILIDPLKFQVRDDISIMKMAEIEMRLSRIDFGNYNPKKDSKKGEPLTFEKLQDLKRLQKT